MTTITKIVGVTIAAILIPLYLAGWFIVSDLLVDYLWGAYGILGRDDLDYMALTFGVFILFAVLLHIGLLEIFWGKTK